MFVCKYLAHLLEKGLTSFKDFLYSEVPTMSLPLGYWSAIAPINMLLKSGSSISILSTSSDSEITSGQINIESNKQYKHKVEWCNIWINGFLGCRKVLRLWNIGITERTWHTAC